VVVLAGLLALPAAGRTQLAPQPKPKPKPKAAAGLPSSAPAKGLIRINTEIDCVLVVDNDAPEPLSATEVRDLRLTQGPHLLKALDATGAVRWTQWVKVRTGGQDGVTVRFSGPAVPPAVLPPILLPVGAALIPVPPGTFDAGCNAQTPSCKSDDHPRRRVTLTRSTWMLATPVTVAQYRAFAREDGVRLAPAQQRFTSQSQTFVHVKWNEAAAYCQWMRGRLPSEAEWERAAQMGSFRDAGVWEWTNDWHGATAPGPAIDPRGPSAGQNRVTRQGIAGGAPRRDNLAPDGRFDDVGFRCVADRPQ
jgi:formylglycine-generating enzyme required for sulfatase activity